MPITKVMSKPTPEHASLISDFPFIAHDGGAKSRKQIPTFVRAHVMERYHRERRAKKGIKDSGNPVWSQHEFIAPVGQGQVLKWEDDSAPVSKPRPKRKTPPPVALNTKTKSKQKSSVVALPPRTAKESVEVLDPRLFEEHENLDSITAGVLDKVHVEGQRTRSHSIAPSTSRDEEGSKFDSSYGQQAGKNQEESLTMLRPYDPMEEKGVHLIQVLDEYYGVLPRSQKATHPCHTVWIPFAFSDPLLFHASLSKFSLHLAATCGHIQISTEPLKHKALAIQTITERLSRPMEAPNDQMIAAVLCLIGTEMLGHDLTAFKAHLKGLRQMIAVRGGVNTLGPESLLLAGYLSYEYVVAAMSTEFESEEEGQQGRNAIGLPAHLIHAMVLPSSSGIFTLGRAFVDPTAHGFTKNTVDFLIALCDHLLISDVFINWNTGTDNPKKRLQTLIAEFISLDYEIVESRGSSLFSTLDLISGVDHVLQALITTAILQFPHLYISPLSRQQLVTKLKYHLLKTPIVSYWKPIPGALLWCLMVGLAASNGSDARAWFVANTIRDACGIAFENLEGIRVALETFNRLAKQQEQNAMVVRFL